MPGTLLQNTVVLRKNVVRRISEDIQHCYKGPLEAARTAAYLYQQIVSPERFPTTCTSSMESGRGFGPFQKSRAKKSNAVAQAQNSVSPAVVTQYGTPRWLRTATVQAGTRT